ncbi:MAG: DMT family transporter [Sneathiella sp.]
MEKSKSVISGLLFMVIASALIALTTLIAKALGNSTIAPALHPLQISAGRFFFAVLALIPFAIGHRFHFKSAPWKLHSYRSICGWLGASCMFAAASQMPLADATALSFLSPIATMILAAIFLREVIPGNRWFFVLLSFMGVILITRPGSDTFQPAALIALLAALLMGLEAIFLKKLTGTEKPLQILIINNCIGAIISITIALSVWRQPSLEQWMLLILLGVAMVLAQSCFIQAMRRADASVVMPLFYLTTVFAAFYDFLFFDENFSLLSTIGILLIVSNAFFLTKSSH